MEYKNEPIIFNFGVKEERRITFKPEEEKPKEELKLTEKYLKELFLKETGLSINLMQTEHHLLVTGEFNSYSHLCQLNNFLRLSPLLEKIELTKTGDLFALDDVAGVFSLRILDKLVEEKEDEKVNSETINKLLKQITYTYDRIGSKAVLCSAYLGTFNVAQGFSSCVNKSEFNLELGCTLSKEKLDKILEDKLWEFMGFALFKDSNPELFS